MLWAMAMITISGNRAWFAQTPHPQPSTQIKNNHVICVRTHDCARKLFLTHTLLFHSHRHNQDPTAKRARAHTHKLTHTHPCAHARAVLAHADAGW